MENNEVGKAPSGSAKCDAIHIAVAPVIAVMAMNPGQHCGRMLGGAFGPCEHNIGIVDPFGKSVVAGESFWLFLYPNTITGMRHEWEHPAFVDTREPSLKMQMSKESSEAWLRAFARDMRCDYREMLEHAEAYQSHGNYWVDGGRFGGMGNDESFWIHYLNVTGKHVTDTGNFFSCSC